MHETTVCRCVQGGIRCRRKSKGRIAEIILYVAAMTLDNTSGCIRIFFKYANSDSQRI